MVIDEFKQAGMAEWDQRQAFHKRLHEAILLCHNSLIAENYNDWFKGLLVLYTELSSHIDAKLEEELKVTDKINDIGNVVKSPTKTKNNYELLVLFSNVQQTLHMVMRRKGFDVPIKGKREKSILESEGSY